MNEDEAVRYDRQIRLWGKGTQQRLMQTRVVFRDCGGRGCARGEAAEVAKNLVLAGVGEVVLELPSDSNADSDGTVRSDNVWKDGQREMQTNFLLQKLSETPSSPAAAVETCAEALASLNPLVRCHAARAPASASAPSEAGVNVEVLQVASLAEARAAVSNVGDEVDAALVLFARGGVSLALLLEGHGKAATLEELAGGAGPVLAAAPHAYQMAVLRLHVLSDASGCTGVYSDALACVLRCAAELRLAGCVTVDDVAGVAAEVADGAVDSVATVVPDDVVLATIAGAAVAQHVIHVVGSPGERHRRWLLTYTTENATETLVEPI